MFKQFNRFLGGILLISGTTIGAGMLAMPIVTGIAGFYPSLILFILIWGFMMMSAFFFLDVNLAISGEPNLITMASKTLGPWGRGATWFFYLLLLYSLVAAYISGSTSIIVSAIEAITGYVIPSWLAPFSLPVLFGGFIYLGTKGVDYLNRFLVIGFIFSYVLLVGFVPSCTGCASLAHSNWPALSLAVTVVTTSFGYHIIIPSLTTYLKHDVKLLRWTIVVGSLLPLIIYIIWQYVILGIIPLPEILAAYHAGEAATEPLAQIVQSPWLSVVARFFAFFAIITSFLGVSLSLSDFLIDGFRLKKTWEGRLIALLLTFIPPLFFVFAFEKGFYLALQYAGIFVAVLLIFLPAIMAWHLKKPKIYRSFWGRVVLLLVMFFSFAIIVINILQKRGLFDSLISI